MSGLRGKTVGREVGTKEERGEIDLVQNQFSWHLLRYNWRRYPPYYPSFRIVFRFTGQCALIVI